MKASTDGFELFDHTADLGVRVRAASLHDLIRLAGDALYAAIGELATEGPETLHVFDLRAADPAVVLRDYLAELLYAFEARSLKATRIGPSELHHAAPPLDVRLLVEVWFAAVDRGHSSMAREVKAVTYHDLDLNHSPEGYEARFIVDI